jgi:hypothetical protein
MRRVEVSSSPGPSPFSHSPDCLEEEFSEVNPSIPHMGDASHLSSVASCLGVEKVNPLGL